jgi:hypothetical protein
MNTFNLDKNYQQFNFEEISVDELEIISGGSGGISGYEGAGAILTVLGVGATIATAPISAVVIGISLGAAAGLAIAQACASYG